ncbi:MFS transporter [Paenibacillus polymyxa]|uniref:MFS transporter n=1 Tax=Paenibacillus polymyxa TaxID=1406 RepID=UPI0023F64C6D|nr:MFS transporter [Paenibacillus polymyxa]
MKTMQVETKMTLWSNLSFLYLWIGNIFYNFGFQIYIITLPLYINMLTGSALAMSMMRAIDIIPSILAGIIGGVIIDRYSRKKMIIIMTSVQILVLLMIILLIYIQQIDVWLLYLLGFVLSFGGAMFWSSYTSILPQIVTSEQLIDANSRMMSSSTIINMVAPGIAGLIIVSLSYIASFSAFLIGLFIVLFLTLFLRVRDYNEHINKKGKSFWKDFKEGILILYEEKNIFTPTIVILTKNFANSLIIGIIIFYASNILGANEKQVGLIYSIAAIGGLISSLLIPKIRKKLPRGKIFLYSILIDLIGMLLVTLSVTWWMMAFSFFIRTAGVTMSNIVYSTIRQEVTPNHLLGRVAGTSSLLIKLTMPLGLLVSGIWAEFLPIRYLFICSTLIIAILYWVLRKHPFVRII